MKMHPPALVDSGALIGKSKRIRAIVHVCDGAVVDEDCQLCSHTFFEKGLRVHN